MIISDLEYIELAENSEIQGGKCCCSNTNAQAYGDDDVQAYGDDTNPYTDTFVAADAKVGFRGSNRSRR
ncbi:MAG: hypothetical protein KME09_16975 [Pleurocapsa minor HA4230-MV1]|jgi:hypothetical protein|nr:hypothetical protein [Pleurocapsa minor HA4230-MV1]